MKCFYHSERCGRRESESEGSETGDYGEVDNLEEAGIGLPVVGEGDVEVVELGAVGVELKLSGSAGSELGITVLDTGEGDPEVFGLANALVPLIA